MFKKIILFFPIAVVILSSAHISLAYKIETHSDLSAVAAERSILAFDKGDYLNKLGFNKNLEETISGNSVEDWIKDGSKFEDNSLRYLNHFHNPLEPWPDAGLDDLLFSGKSSLLWAQETTNEFSWQNVRQYFYDALTSSSEASRDDSFAKMFEGLGHLLHLVQDSASPPHVRNDAHILEGAGLISGLETWSNNNPDLISLYASPLLPAVDLNVSVGGYEPITQFFDTDQYQGLNPSTSTALGLAEYTNANFASEDTIFTENFDSTDNHYFPFPRKVDTEKYDEDIGGGKYRTYFRKIGNGEILEHFAVAGRLYQYLSFWPAIQRYFISLDAQCHEEYAQKLISRAVGYSVGLLNYFFRGEIDLVPDNETGSGYVIVNNTEEDMEGTFEIYYDNADDNADEERQLLWNGDFTIGTASSGNNKSSNIDFIEPDDAKEPGKYILIFKGKLGNESEAVVGKVLVPGILETVYVTMTVGATQRCFVWDASGNAYALVNKNDGNPVSFPCDPADISNWVGKQTNIGSALFSVGDCGRRTVVDWSGCPEHNWGTAGDGSGSAEEESDCGCCGLVDSASWTCGFDTTTLCYPDKPPGSRMDAGDSWWDIEEYISAFGYRKARTLEFLNGSNVIGVCREERQRTRSQKSHSADGAACGDNADCDNFIMYWDNDSGTAKYFLPLAGEIFSQGYTKSRSWDVCRFLGQTTNLDVPAAGPFILNGSFTDKIIVQIYAFEMLTESVEVACNNFDWGDGQCVGLDCIGEPWSGATYCPYDANEVNVFHGLKLTAQVGVFPDGTDGVDPTSLSRNSSFESAISGMYDVLRVVESVPNDEKANVTITLLILKE